MVKHSAIRQHIIETASDLFYRNGYNSTGINEIISESGIAKATLYNHFRSKEDICLAYLQFKNEIFLKELEAFCRAKKEGVPQLLAIFDFLQQFFQKKDFNGCWCIKTVSEIPKENKSIRSEIQAQKHGFLQLITKLVQSNLDIENKTKIETTAKQVYLLYESAVAESHLHQSDWPIQEAKNISMRILD